MASKFELIAGGKDTKSVITEYRKLLGRNYLRVELDRPRRKADM